MNPLSILGAAVVLWVVLIPFTSYCIVDSDQPTLPSRRSTFLLTQAMLTGTGVCAFYFHSARSEHTLVTTMLFVGMLFAAASVDPNQVKRTVGEPLTSYLQRFTVERVRRAATYKIVVYISAAIATYTFPEYWYLAVLFVVLHLHYYKMAGCIVTEARTSRPQDAPKEIRRKWAWRAVAAAIALMLLLKGPQMVFAELKYIPRVWGAFGGFTLMSAAFFLVGSLTANDA